MNTNIGRDDAPANIMAFFTNDTTHAKSIGSCFMILTLVHFVTVFFAKLKGLEQVEISMVKRKVWTIVSVIGVCYIFNRFSVFSAVMVWLAGIPWIVCHVLMILNDNLRAETFRWAFLVANILTYILWFGQLIFQAMETHDIYN